LCTTITSGFSEISAVIACAPASVFQFGSRMSKVMPSGSSASFRPIAQPSVRSKPMATGT
jgi:hypothetical protein